MKHQLFIVAITFFFSSCSSLPESLGGFGAEPEIISPPESSTEIPLYRIGAGDLVAVSVWGNSELSLTIPVRPDGYISLPLVGDVLARESTAEELADSIADALSSQIRSPQVTVIVTQVNSVQYTSRVRVTGAVRAPRSLPFARGMSVLDAILEAGGVNEVASPNRAKLYRTVDGQLQEFTIRLDDILQRGLLDTNYQIQPGDVLTVPERLF